MAAYVGNGSGGEEFDWMLKRASYHGLNDSFLAKLF